MSQNGTTQIQDGTLVASVATLNGNPDIATGATLELNQPIDATYAGNITGGGSLIKNGEGETILTGANTYAGDTTINAGTLTGNIGQGTLTVNSGATYKVADGVADFSLSGILGSGTINLNAASLTLNVATGTSIFNFEGSLTGGDQLIKTGAGVIELQTAAALTNGVAIKNGALKLADQSFINAPITLGDTATVGMIQYTGTEAWAKNIALTGSGGGFNVASGTQALAAATAITGTGNFIKTGAGALDITAAATDYAGNTQVQAGRLIGSASTIRGSATLSASTVLEFNQAIDGVYSGNISGAGTLQGIALQFFWLVTLLFVGKFLMSRAMKKIIVQGG
jgi:autotransporter-associated beta strand protein